MVRGKLSQANRSMYASFSRALYQQR